AFASMLKQHRPDVKIMANSLLKRIPELADVFIGVNPYGGKNALKDNIRPLKEALSFLKNGGLLVTFPAGDVSNFDWQRMGVHDGKWDSSIVKMALKTDAKIVPVFIDGRNSLWFYLVAMIHPLLKTLMLPRELINKHGKDIKLHIGAVINNKQLKNCNSADDIAEYLRLHTYMLPSKKKSLTGPNETIKSDYAEIVSAVPAGLMETEINSLTDKHLLLESGELRVYYAHSRQIPGTLKEIGRLRELTFRAVGEGTGKPIDIDLYDAYYWHLFIWNTETREIVGGYRLGCADDILEKFGKKGLYSHSLFKYSKSLLKTINPAIEMGRSFVRIEYQRSFMPLMLLWKGIGQFIVQHPQYAMLFGPVSISNNYNSVSQQLLIDFLKANNFDANMGRHIRPRQPYKGNISAVWRHANLGGMHTLDNISELVAVLENDNKGVPVLIKQYLKLGGRMLGFNVDKSFSDCIDGLIMVDLRKTDPRVLQKYMGREGAEYFLDYHQSKLQKAG
ncbi:MAG: lysophospholipid acyltransferase family protein, partial [Gammaproteobacteria bacterium]|nr:lysophospholipid acyltransferase family protein [Gammaproteobacteria bacterium]